MHMVGPLHHYGKQFPQHNVNEKIQTIQTPTSETERNVNSRVEGAGKGMTGALVEHWMRLTSVRLF